MKLNFQRAHRSIQSAVTDRELPDFVVLVGPNGAGKSHLLEAILDGSMSVDGVQASQDPRQSEIKLFSLGSLIPNSGGGQQPAQFRDVWARIRPEVSSLAQRQFGYPYDAQTIRDNSDAYLSQLSQSTGFPKQALAAAQEAAGKVLPEFSDQDFRDYFPLYSSTGDLFQYSVTDVFLTYFAKWDGNKYAKFLNLSEGVSDATWIEDSDFVAKFGRPPWEVLDEVLELMGLHYRFVRPVNLPMELPYQPRLLASDTGAEVDLDALSSGEKVLLSLALGLYAGDHLSQSFERPKLLLLDEADASLHPQMIRSLLYVADKVLRQDHGVRVILATHSPTTVALANEEAIFALRRVGQPRLSKVSREVALAQLTVGIPTLGVRVEDRRQVFVESEYDERYYDAIYTNIKSRLTSPFSLQFIASGSGGAGSCNAVIALVNALRVKGNQSVYGVIDRDDSRGGAPEFVSFMPQRYAIESYILDPLLVGLYVWRAGIRRAEDFGLAVGSPYFKLQESEFGAVVGRVQRDVFGDAELNSEIESRYLGGATCLIDSRYASIQGHALEERVLNAYPKLRALKGYLQAEICRTVMAEIPDVTPMDFVDLFGRLAGADWGCA